MESIHFNIEKGPPHIGHLSEFTKPNEDLQLGQYTFAALVFPFGSGIITVSQLGQCISSEDPTTPPISIVEPHLGHLYPKYDEALISLPPFYMQYESQ